jgi:radical SAM superfamily enzyme YgiQ (UPF0313 family)
LPDEAVIRILLCDPHGITAKIDNTKRYPNYGILSIVGYARKYIKNCVFRYLPSTNPFEYNDVLISLRPDIIGVSSSSLFKKEAFETLSFAKRLLPRVYTIIGGAHGTVDPIDVLNNSPTDVVVIGEGEISFARILQRFKTRASLDDVPGIAFRSPHNRIVINPPAPFINLEELPSPAWDLIDPTSFQGHPPIRKYPMGMVVTTRGCPYECVFCSNPVWRISTPRVRWLKPLQIAQEVQYLMRQGIKEIRLGGDQINLNMEWAYEMISRIREVAPEDVVFTCNVRANNVTARLADQLKQAHFWMVNLGIESFCGRVLKGIKKTITRQQIFKAIETLREFGIKVYGNMMLYNVWEEDGQLQYQTPLEVAEDLRMARSLIIHRKLNYISWAFATPIPGSELWEIARRHNLSEVDSGHSCDRLWTRPMLLPGIHPRTMNKHLKDGFKLQFLAHTLSGGFSIRHWRRAVSKLGVLISRTRS